MLSGSCTTRIVSSVPPAPKRVLCWELSPTTRRSRWRMRACSGSSTPRGAAEKDAETIRRSAELHDRLTRLVLQGADVDEVTREISAVFKGSARVLQPGAQELEQ